MWYSLKTLAGFAIVSVLAVSCHSTVTQPGHKKDTFATENDECNFDDMSTLAGFWLDTQPPGGHIKTSVIFDIHGLSYDQRNLVDTLQGLVNRKGPRLLQGYSGYWSDGSWNTKWASIYEKEYGLKFKKISGLMNLLQEFRGDYNGLVVYDPAIDGTRCVAMTIAGIENLLPVNDPTTYVSELGLSIVHDLRGQFSNSVEAYAWALKNVMPRCNRRFAHTPAGGRNVDGLYLGWGFEAFDYCVMNKGFIFNLTFEYTDVQSFGRTINGNTAQADMYRAILAALESPAFLAGYGEWEMNWFDLVGQNGHYYLHWGDNWSFHAQVSAKAPLIKQKKHFTTDNVTVDPDKYYVCFMSSEGDTMKGPEMFFQNSWFDTGRGTVAMNWALHPVMARFPAMLEYYYSTATDNDYFVGMQPFNYEMKDIENFARMIRTETAHADLRILSGDYGSKTKVPQRKKAFAEIVKPLGVFDIIFEGGITREGYLEYLADGTPVVGTGSQMPYWHRILGGWNSNWKAMYEDPAQKQAVLDALVGEIELIAAGHKPPFIIIIYTDLHGCNYLPSFHADVAGQLDSNFKVTRMDEALAAIRKWKQQNQ